MIDLKSLRADPDSFRVALGRKRYDPDDLDRVLALDVRTRALKSDVEGMRARRNTVSKAIPRLAGDEKQSALVEMKELSTRLKDGEGALRTAEEELHQALILIPNPPDSSAPDGAGDDENVEVRRFGEPAIFSFATRDHLEIGEMHDWIDVKRAARTSGARFAYIKGTLVEMEFALVRFALDRLMPRGFRPVVPPILVRESAMYGTGFFPADRNEIYKVEDEDAFLVGTSEVSLAALHMDETLDGGDLPVRYAGFSTCLRREAGTYGKDTRGIFRVHQFDKVEMFSFCSPDSSRDEHELLLAIEEEIMQSLELAYRVVNVCTGDLGAPAAKKYDVEAWMPGQGAYRELTSCSNCTDFQARRLNVRSKGDRGREVLHTLNGTAVAVGRTLIALLETHQQADGTVRVPAALQSYLGGRETLHS